MAITKAIPSLWSGSILASLRKSLVYGNLVNKDYEGEIKDKGSSVKIIGIGSVTVKDYTKDTDMDAPESLTDSESILTIDQAKYFNFQVDDVDAAQASVKLRETATEEAGYSLADAYDRYIAGLYTGVNADNIIGSDITPKVPTKTDAYDYLVDMGVKMDKANIPRVGRWVVVPPWFYGLLLKNDQFIKADAAKTVLSAQVGMGAGFNVYISNNVPNTTGTKYKIIAGTNRAISVADQIVKTEFYRPEKRFADGVKGLHVYGGKLIRPSGIVVLTANES